MSELVEHLEIVKRSLSSFPDASSMYSFANQHVKEHRLQEYNRSLASMITAQQGEINQHWFMREYLWVVYVSGFSAEIISSKYNKLLIAHQIEDGFGSYIPIKKDNILSDLAPVFEVFKNKKKADAIQQTRKLIFYHDWPYFYDYYVKQRDPEKLDLLPNIGPALACHLARNLGNDKVCKPDVHLNRLAERYGYDSAADLCRAVSPAPIGLTDLILWFAAKDHGTI